MADRHFSDKERPKEIDAEVYKRGIALAKPSQPSTSKEDAERDALQPVSGLGAFPLVRPSEPSELPELVKSINRRTGVYLLIWAVLAVVLLRTLRAFIVVATGAALVVLHFHHSIRKLQLHEEEEEADRFEARSEAMQAASLPESVEWLNALVEGIWPRIPAEMFSSVADMLEDVIQANLPKFITEVKCAELTQGKNSMKVLSSRLLPPSDEDEEEAKWNGGVKKHVQLEVAFAYRARGSRRGIANPTKENTRKIESDGDLPETTSKGQDARILFLFQVKLGPTALQLPVKVVLNGLVGIAHVRLELTNCSPFMGDMAISFVGLPRVSLDVVPLKLSLAEVPGLSGLIQSSVDSALEMYTLPKSLKLNMGEMLVGDGIKRESDACGIVLVTIHSAHDLERSDLIGVGDPYARISWTRTTTVNTKVTRVIMNDLNPIWEQTFALVVSPQVLAALHSTGLGAESGQGESVCVEIFDSDTSSEDDFMGRAKWSLQDALSDADKGKMHRREDSLSTQNGSGQCGGRISWSVGYFPKKEISDDQQNKETKDEKVEEGKEAESKPTEETKPAIERFSPSVTPSLGILSIQIHGITSLKFKGASADEALEEAPSSYVEVLLANRFVFKSRTKMDDGEPYFNAITEQVCDWRSSSCVFVVRENKVAGKNAILGVVPIQLHDAFQKSSLVTETYPMAGGIGSGRLRLSLLFRSLEIPKSAPLLPASVGLLTVHALRVNVREADTLDDLQHSSLDLSTVSAKAHLSSRQYSKTGDESCEWQMEGPICLPIYRREATAMIVKMRLKKTALQKKQTIVIAVLWLNQIPDEDGSDQNLATRTFELALWDVRSNKQRRKHLERNWTSRTERDETKIGMRLRGTLQVQLDFHPGMTRLHAKANKSAGDSSKVYEAWCAVDEAGLGDQSKALENIPPDPNASGDNSSDESDKDGKHKEGKDEFVTAVKNKEGMNTSGSRGQLINRFVRRGDHETTSIKDEIRDNFTLLKNKFHTDNDKSNGVETEV
ncbi:hypothetical protein CBS101457_003170 [Exobasidium rhododendri]|nr:hypothetical protein CBS101457_003170 [Exobasidium rhododendri]